MINLKELITSGVDSLNILVTRQEVINKDYSQVLPVLQELTSDLYVAKYFRERVDIAFDGFQNTPEEVWEIVEIRNFVNDLDERFPFWLYFLSKHGNGLYAIIKCFLLPYIKPELQQAVNGPRLQAYLEQRGFPAMNYLCNLIGLSDDENVAMTNRFVKYFSEKH